MTRFTRAKGSKASNERLPEDSTSWTEMKQQLEESKKYQENESKRVEADAMRLENYNKFLKESEESQKSSWAEFPEALVMQKKPQQVGKISGTKQSNNGKNSKKHNRNKQTSETDDISNNNNAEEPEVVAPNETKRKLPENNVTPSKKQKIDSNQGMPGKQKNKKVKKEPTVPFTLKKSLDDMDDVEKAKFMKSKEKKRRQWLKRKEKKLAEKAELKAQKLLNNPVQQNAQNEQKPKEKVKGFDADAKRRKPKQEIRTINGEEMEISYFDGFPIPKGEAERLGKLRKEMIIKGLPRQQVQAALKLERRKAEKALARMKKFECYSCRKTGHTINECPELNNSSTEMIPTGICLKCGSTEHSYNQCRMRGEEFKFATCFICKEQGHISRQCPDNARGLYPKGGACKMCGDVTHLKKDCPKNLMQKQSNTIFLDTLSNENVEGLEGPKKIAVGSVSKAKHVKFD